MKTIFPDLALAIEFIKMEAAFMQRNNSALLEDDNFAGPHELREYLNARLSNLSNHLSYNDTVDRFFCILKSTESNSKLRAAIKPDHVAQISSVMMKAGDYMGFISLMEDLKNDVRLRQGISADDVYGVAKICSRDFLSESDINLNPLFLQLMWVIAGVPEWSKEIRSELYEQERQSLILEFDELAKQQLWPEIVKKIDKHRKQPALLEELVAGNISTLTSALIPIQESDTFHYIATLLDVVMGDVPVLRRYIEPPQFHFMEQMIENKARVSIQAGQYRDYSVLLDIATKPSDFYDSLMAENLILALAKRLNKQIAENPNPKISIQFLEKLQNSHPAILSKLTAVAKGELLTPVKVAQTAAFAVIPR